MASQTLRFDGRVALVTGAGGGLGRAYALFLAQRGAKVVVNDVGSGLRGEGADASPAEKVVAEIKQAGGDAVVDAHSVTDGDKVVQTAIDAFGRIDIVINNAGVLRDVTLVRMSQRDWDLVYEVHLKGTMAVTKAALVHMREANYGRIVFVSSVSGLYGNRGQTNYGSMKSAVIAFARGLQQEVARNDIVCNVISPVGASRMTETIFPPQMLKQFEPAALLGVLGVLCHQSCPARGETIEVGGGYAAAARMARGKGVVLSDAASPEATMAQWKDICSLEQPVFPSLASETFSLFVSEVNKAKAAATGPTTLLGYEFSAVRDSYVVRDVLLYAYSVGAHDLRFSYERHPQFCVFPTFASTRFVYPFLADVLGGRLPGVRSSPESVLHASHVLRVHRELPSSAHIVTRGKVTHVYTAGKGTFIGVALTTFDEGAPESPLCTNELLLYVRYPLAADQPTSGPFQMDAGKPGSGAADFETTAATQEFQAHVFRLNGDFNPLHIDPKISGAFGFAKPILHGMCSYGCIAAALAERFPFTTTSGFVMQSRFRAPVIPGETLKVAAWAPAPATADATTLHVVASTSKVVVDQCVVTLPKAAPRASL